MTEQNGDWRAFLAEYEAICLKHGMFVDYIIGGVDIELDGTDEDIEKHVVALRKERTEWEEYIERDAKAAEDKARWDAILRDCDFLVTTGGQSVVQGDKEELRYGRCEVGAQHLRQNRNTI